jgi:hypothetical protein
MTRAGRFRVSFGGTTPPECASTYDVGSGGRSCEERQHSVDDVSPYLFNQGEYKKVYSRTLQGKHRIAGSRGKGFFGSDDILTLVLSLFLERREDRKKEDWTGGGEVRVPGKGSRDIGWEEEQGGRGSEGSESVVI